MATALKKRMGAALAVLALSTAGLVATAAPASAAGGTVSCATSRVVGVWVDVDGGTDGWATRSTTSNPNINNWSYNTQNKRWRVRVGCGGTPSNWAQSISSGWSNRQGAASIICADTGYLRTCRIG